MNVDDVKEVTQSNEDKLISIFLRQKELMEKYHTIEEKAGVGYGLLAGRVFHLDDQRSQELCKNFAWRISEELAESFEAGLQDDIHHAKEELADALHFLVELWIICGIDPADVFNTGDNRDLLDVAFAMAKESCDHRDPFEVDYWKVVLPLGLAMNCLKQKPWKQTHISTDSLKFKAFLVEALIRLFGVMYSQGMTPNECFSYYFKKSKVNEFRQETNY